MILLLEYKLVDNRLLFYSRIYVPLGELYITLA
jgi:hypothetical protein